MPSEGHGGEERFTLKWVVGISRVLPCTVYFRRWGRHMLGRGVRTSEEEPHTIILRLMAELCFLLSASHGACCTRFIDHAVKLASSCGVGPVPNSDPPAPPPPMKRLLYFLEAKNGINIRNPLYLAYLLIPLCPPPGLKPNWERLFAVSSDAGSELVNPNMQPSVKRQRADGICDALGR